MSIRNSIRKISNQIKTIYPNSDFWNISRMLICDINGRIDGETLLKIANIMVLPKEDIPEKTQEDKKIDKKTLKQIRHEYYMRHREELLEKSKNYYYENREEVNEKNKARNRRKRLE